MEINFYCRLLDADQESKLMVMIEIPKVVTQMTVLLKRNLECRHLLLENKITRKKKKEYKKKGNDTKDKLLPPDNSGEEADEELFSAINSSTATCNTSSESGLEV